MSEVSEFRPVQYQLLESEFIHNSPYHVEGDEKLVLGIPPKRNLPYQYNVTTGNKSRQIRLIIGCETPFVDEQIKLGHQPVKERIATPEEREALTIFNGQLMVYLPEVESFLQLLPHVKGSKSANVRGVRQIVYKKDIEKELDLELEAEEREAKAKSLILSWELPKAKEVIRLRYHSPLEEGVTLKQLRKMLYDLVKNESDGVDFILENEGKIDQSKSIEVLVIKAYEQGIISWNAIPNKVSLMENDKYIPVVTIQDDNTPTGKQNRFIEFLNTTNGRPLLERLSNLIPAEDEYESELAVEEKKRGRKPREETV